MRLIQNGDAFAVVLTAKEAAKYNVQANVAPSAPAERTFRTKAERAAGDGFPCSCGRNDLRVAVHAGSFHKRPDGTTHQL